MTTTTISRAVKFLLYGYGQLFLILQPMGAMVPAFAKMIENPDAILTSTITTLSMLFALIGAIAAIGAMPAIRSAEVDRWMIRRFLWLTKHQRDRHYPILWIAEAFGIFLYVFLTLKEENRVNPILSLQAITLLAFVWIPIGKGIWTFVSFAIPTFLFRCFTASNRIKSLQLRFGVGFVGFKKKYRLRYSRTLFLLGATGAVLSFVVDDESPLIHFGANAIVTLAIIFPTLAILSRIALECPQIRESNAGRRIGTAARRWLLASEATR